MKAYKLNSTEFYRVVEERFVLEVEYTLAYRRGEVEREKVHLYFKNIECAVVTEKGEKSRFTDTSAVENLGDKVLVAIELLPGHVKQPIKIALER